MAKDFQVSESTKGVDTVKVTKNWYKHSNILQFAVSFNLNMNKPPNPSYYNTDSPMMTSHEERDALRESTEMTAQNKFLHSCSLETFFQRLQGFLLLSWEVHSSNPLLPNPNIFVISQLLGDIHQRLHLQLPAQPDTRVSSLTMNLILTINKHDTLTWLF